MTEPETMHVGRRPGETDAEHRRRILVWYLLPFADDGLRDEGLAPDIRADLEAKRDRWRDELVDLEVAHELEVAAYFASLEASFRHGYGGEA